jgi:excisionase family DNA binding protein
MHNQTKRKVYTIKELVEMTGLSKDYFYQEARKGNIPGKIDIPNVYLFNRTAIDKWLGETE